VAAHITAASPGGKRFDDSLSSKERSSYNNGIWLCQLCAKMIDSDSFSYPVVLLHEWKVYAEKKNARDANANTDDIAVLIVDIDNLISIIVDHLEKTRSEELVSSEPIRGSNDFMDHCRRMRESSVIVRDDYMRNVFPNVLSVYRRCISILGEGGRHIRDIPDSVIVHSSSTNRLAKESVIQLLGILKSELEMR